MNAGDKFGFTCEEIICPIAYDLSSDNRGEIVYVGGSSATPCANTLNPEAYYFAPCVHFQTFSAAVIVTGYSKFLILSHLKHNFFLFSG